MDCQGSRPANSYEYSWSKNKYLLTGYEYVNISWRHLGDPKKAFAGNPCLFDCSDGYSYKESNNTCCNTNEWTAISECSATCGNGTQLVVDECGTEKRVSCFVRPCCNRNDDIADNIYTAAQYYYKITSNAYTCVGSYNEQNRSQKTYVNSRGINNLCGVLYKAKLICDGDPCIISINKPSKFETPLNGASAMIGIYRYSTNTCERATSKGPDKDYSTYSNGYLQGQMWWGFIESHLNYETAPAWDIYDW